MVKFSVYLNRRAFIMYKIPVFNANAPFCSAASDLSLHCLSKSLLCDAIYRHNFNNNNGISACYERKAFLVI